MALPPTKIQDRIRLHGEYRYDELLRDLRQLIDEANAALSQLVEWSGESFAPAVHDHDDRYYTITEVDTLFDGYYTIGEVDLILSDYYTSSDVDVILDDYITEIESDAKYAFKVHDHDARYYTRAEIDLAYAALMPKAGGRFTGKILPAHLTAGGIATAAYSPAFEISSDPGIDTYMTFHRHGEMAINFGLKTDNEFYLGGASLGGVAYKIWHGGNDGAGSGLDADLLDGKDGAAYRPNLVCHGYATSGWTALIGDGRAYGCVTGFGLNQGGNASLGSDPASNGLYTLRVAKAGYYRVYAHLYCAPSTAGRVYLYSDTSGQVLFFQLNAQALDYTAYGEGVGYFGAETALYMTTNTNMSLYFASRHTDFYMEYLGT